MNNLKTHTNFVSISDLKPNTVANIAGRILSKSIREYTNKAGVKSRYAVGILEDGTGTVTYKVWGDPKMDLDVKFEVGNDLMIYNAAVKEWNGRLEINITSNTTIKKAVNNIVKKRDEQIHFIAEITGKETTVSITGNIKSIKKVLSHKDVSGKEFIVATIEDGTGSVETLFFEQIDLVKENTSLVINDAVVSIKNFGNLNTINLIVNNFTKIRKSISRISNDSKITLDKLYSRYAFPHSLVVEGEIISIKTVRTRNYCSVCKRYLTNDGSCQEHPEATINHEKLFRTIIDDNYGYANLTISCRSIGINEDMQDEDLLKKAEEMLIFSRVQVNGKIKISEYGIDITPLTDNDIKILDDAKYLTDRIKVLEEKFLNE